MPLIDVTEADAHAEPVDDYEKAYQALVDSCLSGRPFYLADPKSPRGFRLLKTETLEQ